MEYFTKAVILNIVAFFCPYPGHKSSLLIFHDTILIKEAFKHVPFISDP